MRYILAIVLAAIILLNSVPSVTACGPFITQPIYVFQNSPDLPFEEFTNGKIGIVRPSFGRKTLFIAYRYLNGGAFTPDEQNDLVAALKGTAPEESGAEAVKAWVEARKQFLKDDQQLPKIYTERSYGGYDFFPNCTKNAFEVAFQTLNDRVASYGADDPNVRTWLAGQDTVFKNCSGSSQMPMELGAESPSWLRKDRDYQTAAAHFYSLNFDEARARFEKIATDTDSPWQPLGGYLVARTFVRQASLSNDETKKDELFEQAESRLQTLMMSGGKFADASKKLLALVKYHIRPAERVIEISRTLSSGGNENLRQDLIDYSWLLDKFESEIGIAEAERRQPAVVADPQPPYAPFLSQEAKDRFERVDRGESIEITIFPKNGDGTSDYSRGISLEFKYDASEAEILGEFEQQMGRKLSADEAKQVKDVRENSLVHRDWRISPNRKFEFGGLSRHEECDYECDKFTLDLVPEFLRSDDLSDWILTLQIEDSRAYSHAFRKWRETGSPAWMITALVKAETSSPRLAKLMQAAERVSRNAPEYPTVAYHLIRLKTAMGQTDQARTLLDDVMSQPSMLPVSAQNQFLEQRTHLARGLNEFLKSAQRKPIAFYSDGSLGKYSHFLEIGKSYWKPDFEQTKEEYERELEENYKDLLPWDDRFGFDSQTVDILNWHFPLELLVEAARNPNVPDYLQRSLALAAWTRAILLDNDEVALKTAAEVVRVEPQMGAVLEPFLKSRTAKERREAALYALLKFPKLSPYVQVTPSTFQTSEELEYYFEEAWWCKPETTHYDGADKEIPKVVPKPAFLTAAQFEKARQEFLAVAAISDGKRFLGRKVIEWAKTSPDDPRIPEALFIAAKANQSYKYGCDGWAYDERTKEEAETLLRQRYADNPWTAKLAQAQR